MSTLYINTPFIIESFSVHRYAKTILIELIPVEWISDKHLDDYCIILYGEDGSPKQMNSIGPSKFEYPEGIILPFEKLYEAFEFIIYRV